MILSDKDIRKELEKGGVKIESDEELYIGPSSVDLKLSDKAKILSSGVEVLDCREDNSTKFESYNGWEHLRIYPGEFYILSTKEKITLPKDVAGFVYGRSSLGRLGLNIHLAGFVDPGFSGTITLEVSNFTKVPIMIYAGMRICQIVLLRTESECAVGYSEKKDQKYIGQIDPEISRSHLDI